MIFGRRRAAQVPVPVGQRWHQVFESGEVALHPFSRAELDAVTLEPESVRPESGMPYLERLSPLLGQAPLPAALPEPESGGDWWPGDEWAQEPEADAALTPDAATQAADMRELASAVAELEAAGFVRPAPPAPPEGQMPIEFAGVAAVADGTPPRRVALAGDLGLITYMQCRPLFVAEVYRAPDPARPDRAPASWQLVARGFVPYEMPGCLIERPPAPTGEQPPRVILREDRAAVAMLGWLGGDVGAYLKLREARAAEPAEPTESAEPAEPAQSARADEPSQAVPTATVAAGFSRLAQLCLMLPAGPQVLLRALAVGSGPDGHWLLTGERLELATPVTLGQLGDRLDEMLATASRPGAAAPPDGRPAE